MAAADVPTRGVFLVYAVDSGDKLTLCTQTYQMLQVVVAHIQCPKMARRLPDGSMTPEEKGAFEAFEFTRSALIGKQVRFEEEVRVEALGRSSGPVTLPDGKDLGLELVRAGLATISDKKPARLTKDQHDRFLLAMQEAKRAGRGIHGTGVKTRVVKPHPPPREVLDAFVAQSKQQQQVKCLIEKVISGAHLSVYVVGHNDQQISVTFTGITCAPARDASGKPASPFGVAAKQHTEKFLLNRLVGLRFDGVDPSNGFALVSIVSPKGETFQASLLQQGLAKTQNATMVFSKEREQLLKAEAAAQAEKAGMWKEGSGAAAAGAPIVVKEGATAGAEGGAVSVGAAAAAAASGEEQVAKPAVSKSGEADFPGTVIQVISGDTLVVRAAAAEDGSTAGVPLYHRLQLAGIRAPRVIKRADGSDPATRGTETRQSYEEYTWEAREFMRKKFIGAPVNVHMESVVASQEQGREPRRTASVTQAETGESLAGALLACGYGKIAVGRNEAPPADIDALIDNEAMARSKKLGMWSEKPSPATHLTEVHRVGEKKGRELLSFLQRGKVGSRPPVLSAVIDTVLSGSSFRVYVPREHFVITLKLAGVSSPAGPGPAAAEGATGDKFWQESKDLAMLTLCNRDVEIMVESSDRTGSFIGYILHKGRAPAATAAATESGAAPKPAPKKAAAPAAAASAMDQQFAVTIVRAGLAAPLNADRTLIAQQLAAAAKEACDAKRYIWSSADALPARVAKRVAAAAAHNVDFTTVEAHPWVPVRLTDVKSNSAVYVSIENEDFLANKKTVDELLRQLSTTAGTQVQERGKLKKGDIIGVLFREDGSWNRARVLAVFDKDCQCQFLDFGNTAEPSFKDVRVIPASAAEKFAPLRDLPPLAEEVSLAFIHPMRPDSEHLNSAIDEIWAFAEAHPRVMGRVEYVIGGDGGRNFVSLSSCGNYTGTLQEQLLKAGLSQIEAPALRQAKATNTLATSHSYLFKALEGAQEAARKSHAGMFVYGDAFSDDDE